MLHFLFAIMDIGSTGTRMNIFGYTKDKILLYYQKYEIQGGLHKMNYEDIKASLTSLTAQLPRYVYKIPMGIYCTAGFRHPLLYSKLNYIKEVLSDPNNNMKFNIKEYGIISGKYEGYLGYQSLKYILDNPDFILIDMGGKSTQVVANNYYTSYKIGYTNIEDIYKTDIKKDKYLMGNKLPVFISSGFTKRKRVKIDEIKNKSMRDFLKKLGVNKDLHGMRVNWTLGMSLRFLNNKKLSKESL